MVSIQKLQMNSYILPLDATEIANLIKSRQITSEECTRTFIQHIRNINPSLNAVVEDRFDAALTEAKEYDIKIDQANFNQQPLYGVPISIKESLNVQGMKTTGGLPHRKDIMMSNDAEAVSRLKKAGAIILCKTNTPALCFCQETDNKLYGRTNNAWGEKYTAGGSSGGEGAIISTGGVAAGLGSDIGGSIRFPSHFNGVVGFKPGKYQVPAEGHFPPDSIPLKARMSGIGPMGKSVRDIRLIYQLISKEAKKKYFYEKMIVDILPTENGYPLSEETASLMKQVHELMDDIYQTTWAIPPFFNDTSIVWQEIMSMDAAKDIKQLAFSSDRPNIWKYHAQEKLTRKTTVHPYLSWALIGAGMFKPSTKRIKEITTFIEQGDMTLESYLKNRILIFPVYHRAALEHGQLYKEIFSIQKTYLKYMPYIAYANVWGLPALTVPIGFDEHHLPIAVQIISAIGNEEAIFSLGELLEDHFGGYLRSKYYDA